MYGIISTLDRWIAPVLVRTLIVFFYLVFGAAVAVLFPDTPDELLRIETAYANLAAGRYESFYWPPGNVLTIMANPFLGNEMTRDVVTVRLFNFALAALPLCFVLFRLRNGALMAVALFTAPYGFLVLSTGSQQGLILGLFCVLAWAIFARHLLVFGIAALALYLVNPAMILALPAALICLVRDDWFRPVFAIACLAYVPILITALLVWSGGGEFMPTLSANGPVNIFLGNNPHPMSHRGVGDLQDVLAQYGLEGGSYIDATLAYLKDDPAGFWRNVATKLVLFWMPWDFLRSGMGQGVSLIIFIYIGLAQIAIYATFWMLFKKLERRQIAFAILFCLSAWALYTLFFVKVRFRLPFDFLLLLSCLVTRTATSPPSERAETS